MLRGVILRVMAHPEPYVKQRPAQPPIPIAEADAEALRSFEYVHSPRSSPCASRADAVPFRSGRLVLRHGKDIQHDHHLVWFTRTFGSSVRSPALETLNAHMV